MFLQVEINQVRDLIHQTAQAGRGSTHSRIGVSLKVVEGNLLRFNLLFCDEISEVSSARAMFEIWQKKLSIDRLKANLANHVSDLSSFYGGISTEAQQSKIDLLTVIVSYLGFAQLAIQVRSFAFSLECLFTELGSWQTTRIFLWQRE